MQCDIRVVVVGTRISILRKRRQRICARCYTQTHWICERKILLGMRDKTETHRNEIVRDILDEKLTMYSCRSFDSLALWFAMRMDLLRTVYRGRMCIRVNGIWGVVYWRQLCWVARRSAVPIPLGSTRKATTNTPHSWQMRHKEHPREPYTAYLWQREERGMCLEFTSARMPMAHWSTSLMMVQPENNDDDPVPVPKGDMLPKLDDEDNASKIHINSGLLCLWHLYLWVRILWRSGTHHLW